MDRDQEKETALDEDDSSSEGNSKKAAEEVLPGNPSDAGEANDVLRASFNRSPSPPESLPPLAGLEAARTPLIPATAEAIAAVAAALNSSPNSDLSSSIVTTRKRSSPGTTTARQINAKKAKGASRITSGGRVKVARKDLFHIVMIEEQKTILKGYNDNYNFFGTVVSGTGNKSWKVSFDLFPADFKVAVVTRRRIKLVGAGEDEAPYDKAKDVEKYSEVPKKKKAPTTLQRSEREFTKLPTDDLKVISEYNMQYAADADATITWTILKDNKYLKQADDPFKYLNRVEFLKELNFVGKESVT